MARSRFGENQIKDEDLLTEAEHLAVDHSTVSGIASSHSDLVDDEPEKHRLINDAGTSSTDLLSAEKILAAIAANGTTILYQDTDPEVGDGSALAYLIQTTTGDIWCKDVEGYSTDLCSGGTASCYSALYGSTAARAFDDSFDVTNGTLFQRDTGTNVWIQYQFASAQIIKRVALYPRDGYLDRYPSSFKIMGSNTGAFSGEETTIETFTGITTPSSAAWEYFAFDNANAYTYYRIEMLTIINGSGYCDISEVEMHGISSYTWQKIWDNSDYLTDTVHATTDHSTILGVPTISGYTGQIDVLTSVSGSNYTKGIMYFDDGLLTTFSGGIPV